MRRVVAATALALCALPMLGATAASAGTAPAVAAPSAVTYPAPVVGAVAGNAEVRGTAADFITQGRSASYSLPRDGGAGLHGNNRQLTLDVTKADLAIWLAVPKGQSFIPGRTYAVGADHASGRTDVPTLRVQGYGRACDPKVTASTFRIDDLQRRGDGRVTAADVTIHGVCTTTPGGSHDIHLRLVNPPPLQVSGVTRLAVDPRGEVRATTWVRCSYPTDVSVLVSSYQRAGSGATLSMASGGAGHACAPGRLNALHQRLVRDQGPVFVGGTLGRTQSVGAKDPFYDVSVGTTQQGYDTVTAGPARFVPRG